MKPSEPAPTLLSSCHGLAAHLPPELTADDVTAGIFVTLGAVSGGQEGPAQCGGRGGRAAPSELSPMKAAFPKGSRPHAALGTGDARSSEAGGARGPSGSAVAQWPLGGLAPPGDRVSLPSPGTATSGVFSDAGLAKRLLRRREWGQRRGAHVAGPAAPFLPVQRPRPRHAPAPRWPCVSCSRPARLASQALAGPGRKAADRLLRSQRAWAPGPLHPGPAGGLRDCAASERGCALRQPAPLPLMPTDSRRQREAGRFHLRRANGWAGESRSFRLSRRPLSGSEPRGKGEKRGVHSGAASALERI